MKTRWIAVPKMALIVALSVGAFSCEDSKTKSLRQYGERLMKMTQDGDSGVKDWTLDQNLTITTGRNGECNGHVTGTLLFHEGETTLVAFDASWDDARQRWDSPLE